LVRKYRLSVPFVVGLVVATGFLLLGIAMAVPTSTSDVAEHVIGGFAIAAAAWGGGISWTNSVSLTPDGIVKQQTFRRTSIPWDAVGSFAVAPVPRNQAWRTVKVELRPMGYSYLTPLAGRERYIQRIITEFGHESMLSVPARTATAWSTHCCC
jgi:hypothetical protein